MSLSTCKMFLKLLVPAVPSCGSSVNTHNSAGQKVVRVRTHTFGTWKKLLKSFQHLEFAKHSGTIEKVARKGLCKYGLMYYTVCFEKTIFTIS